MKILRKITFQLTCQSHSGDLLQLVCVHSCSSCVIRMTFYKIWFIASLKKETRNYRFHFIILHSWAFIFGVNVPKINANEILPLILKWRLKVRRALCKKETMHNFRYSGDRQGLWASCPKLFTFTSFMFDQQHLRQQQGSRW